MCWIMFLPALWVECSNFLHSETTLAWVLEIRAVFVRALVNWSTKKVGSGVQKGQVFFTLSSAQGYMHLVNQYLEWFRVRILTTLFCCCTTWWSVLWTVAKSITGSDLSSTKSSCGFCFRSNPGV